MSKFSLSFNSLPRSFPMEFHILFLSHTAAAAVTPTVTKFTEQLSNWIINKEISLFLNNLSCVCKQMIKIIMNLTRARSLSFFSRKGNCLKDENLMGDFYGYIVVVDQVQEQFFLRNFKNVFHSLRNYEKLKNLMILFFLFLNFFIIFNSTWKSQSVSSKHFFKLPSSN